MATTEQISGLTLAQQMETRRPRSAWAMSFVTHVLLVVVLGISWRMVPRGATLEPDRSVGIVLVHEQQGEREYVDPQAQNEANQMAKSEVAQAMPNASEVPAGFSDVLPAAQSVVAGGMAEAILDATKLSGDGTRRRGGMDQGTSTEVFGITGTGTRFVYVFDRSGSMSEYRGRPLEAAKIELRESLQDLQSVHQFQIIFYNDQPRIFLTDTGQAELIWADDQGKEAARSFIQGIKANGATNHMNALEVALRMRPDVIFFLTDADQPALTYQELRRVRIWNKGTTIHAIEFGAGPQVGEENFLVRLARQNGGQHAYVDLRRLKGEH